MKLRVGCHCNKTKASGLCSPAGAPPAAAGRVCATREPTTAADCAPAEPHPIAPRSNQLAQRRSAVVRHECSQPGIAGTWTSLIARAIMGGGRQIGGTAVGVRRQFKCVIGFALLLDTCHEGLQSESLARITQPARQGMSPGENNVGVGSLVVEGGGGLDPSRAGPVLMCLNRSWPNANPCASQLLAEPVGRVPPLLAGIHAEKLQEAPPRPRGPGGRL